MLHLASNVRCENLQIEQERSENIEISSFEGVKIGLWH